MDKLDRDLVAPMKGDGPKAAWLVGHMKQAGWYCHPEVRREHLVEARYRDWQREQALAHGRAIPSPLD